MTPAVLLSRALRPEILIAAAFAVLVTLASAAAPASAPADRAPVLLISMDGFRADYLERFPAQTAHLRQLARDGVSAKGLIPVFPSNTFPNHYSIVTGLYPSRHGIVNNRMFDTRLREFFGMAGAARDSRWWGGEPIWITAVLQGQTSVCSFWPGSEAPVKGMMATRWKPYDYSIPFETRLEELVAWFKNDKPSVATFYFEESNSVGHRNGPDSPEIGATLEMLDKRVAAITSRFAAEGLVVNLIVVADHGMTASGGDKVVVLDDYVDLNTIEIDFDEAVCGFRPAAGADVATIVKALSKMPHAKVYRAEELPAHLHVDPSSPRVPPIWILPDEGWLVMRRAVYTQVKDRISVGQHGYDPVLRSMQGIFIANGPAFRKGVVLPEFENVHIYNLLCAVTGLKPAANDGDDRLVKSALR